MAPREIALVIESRLENVALVGVSVSRISEEAGFSPVDRYNLELCAVEAVTNSVLHAHHGEPGHEIRVRLTLGAEAFEIRVLDDGDPVPESKRAPREQDFDPSDLDSIPEGGRGLFLIHALMDRVEYGTAGGKNVLLMTKALPARPGEP